MTNNMAGNRTFTMIKPDATAAGHTGKIIDRIIGAGFALEEMKWTTLTTAQAQEFYAVHKERPFYGELVEYMTSGPIVAAVLSKDNAVEDYRTLIGATTLRKRLLVLLEQNLLSQLRPMQFTVQIVMTTLRSKEIFSSLK